MHKRTRSLKSTAQRTLVSLAVALGATFGLSAQAAIVSELGDAGQTQASAQVTMGSGTISSIFGSIASTTDADLFVIYIANPAQFFASTDNAGTDPFRDTQLFLLTLAGAPVFINDDASGQSLNSTLPAGDPSGPLSAGLYILGVSMGGYNPVNAGNDYLFANGLPTDVRGPAGGLQPGVLGGFSDDGVLYDPGNYEIQLRGASFAVPEPGSAALVLLAGGALLGVSRQRRRQTQVAESETTAA